MKSEETRDEKASFGGRGGGRGDGMLRSGGPGRRGRRGQPAAGRRRQDPGRLADLPRQLQVLALQRARPDQHLEREGPEGRLEPRHAEVDARPAVLPAGGRRHPLLLGLVQPGVRARRRHRRPGLGLQAEARRRPRLQADALAVQPRHRHRQRPHLHGHARRQAGRHRHEERPEEVGDAARRLEEADRRLHRRAAVRQRQGHHRLAGRRVAVPRPDLRRRRGQRQDALDLLHRRRQRRERPGAQDLGRRLVEDGRRRRLDGRRLRPEVQHGVLGHGQPRAAVRLGRARLEDQGRAAGRQPLHHLGAGARPRHRQAQVLPPGTAARCLGLRQCGRRVRDDRARRQELHRAPEQGRLRVRLRPAAQGAERLAG